MYPGGANFYFLLSKFRSGGSLIDQTILNTVEYFAKLLLLSNHNLFVWTAHQRGDLQRPNLKEVLQEIKDNRTENARKRRLG